MGKKIYQHKMLERCKVDLEEALRQSGTEDNNHCGLVAESKEYLFYRYAAYSDGSGGYILRRNKAKPKEIVFFGRSRRYNCVFHDFLFQVDASGELGRFYITCTNIYSGEKSKCPWLSEKANFISINGYGRFYCQDSVNEMYVADDKLVIKVYRKKITQVRMEDSAYLNDPNNIETPYTLIVSMDAGRFQVKYVFPKAEELVKSEKQVKENRLGRDEKLHIVCQHVGSEQDCPNDCSKCAIALNADGNSVIAQGKVDEAIRHYKKALFVEPRFAEAWVNLGNAYVMKAEYNNAIAAFDKAITIDPKYGEALFGKANALKNIGRHSEALALASTILEMYNDETVVRFRKELSDSIGENSVRHDRERTICLKSKPDDTKYSLERVIEIVSAFSRNLAKSNKLDNPSQEVRVDNALFDSEKFAQNVYAFCLKRYGSFGNSEVLAKTILTAYYGAICAALFYYKDRAGVETETPYVYLSNRLDIDVVDESAEKMLGKAAASNAQRIIHLFCLCSKTTAGRLELQTDMEVATLHIAKAAFDLGVLYAAKCQENWLDER